MGEWDRARRPADSADAPRVDLSSTALDALKVVKMEDLQRFAVSREGASGSGAGDGR
jgi:uncharacterized protein (DUF2237 family)